MTSYIKLISYIQNFFNSHAQVYRFGSDFIEQIDNFTAKNEKYPLVFMSLQSSNTTDYLATFTIDLYCLDIIQKDRLNINNILSDTHLILQDLYRYLKDSETLPIDVLSGADYTPMNNAFCDYLAGNQLTLVVEVETQSLCELPIDIFEDSYPIFLAENNILSGGENTIIVWQ
jgi:hypothetical protein